MSVAACGILMAALVVIGLWQALAADAGRMHAVVIEAMKFAPETIHVRPGDRVTFTNNDLWPHTATAKAAPAFDSGMIKPGETWSLTVPAEGTLQYSCTFHPTMSGRIVVDR